MSRLRWSFSGYVRKMQISKTSLFTFVEGFKDRYFYSQIALSECQVRNVVYQVVTGEELPQSGGGGKQTLLSFFDSLEAKGLLFQRFRNSVTASIFFLDKDIDDIIGIKRDSDHIVYTEHYDIESYLFVYGEIGQAAASAAALDVGTVKIGLGDYIEWRDRAAARWKSWVKLCVFAAIHNVGAGRYYSRPTSQINLGIRGPVDQVQYDSHRSAIELSSGMEPELFHHAFEQVSNRVDHIYIEGKYDQVFKGKWYLEFLEEDIHGIAGDVRFDHRSLKTRMRSALEQTLNLDESWAFQFRTPVEHLVRSLT